MPGLISVSDWKAPVGAWDIARFILASQDTFASPADTSTSPLGHRSLSNSRPNSTFSNASSISQNDSFSPIRDSMISIGSQDQSVVNITDLARKSKQAAYAAWSLDHSYADTTNSNSVSTDKQERLALSPKKTNGQFTASTGRKKRREKVLRSKGEGEAERCVLHAVG
jgi:hypothetical protein